ncbi:hypothetical protein EI94DRAFT_1801674 [Lactarius quietus]|nr:hypothetical protein EI94DRAFT_1801674 [Lactarius quietus]
MNQSDTTNSTDETPPTFRLRRGFDGWGGGNKYFRVVGNVIKIKKSDAEKDIVPTEQMRRKMYDHSGNFSQHVQQYKTDHVYQLWMNKIGPYLADWVLDKRNDPTALQLPWKLIGFPEGYTLWVHLTGDHEDPANPRTDAYLYGSPHKIFRSPMEFVEHAIWLMKGGSAGEQCLCKYCTPGQSQRAINRRLDRGIGDDGEDDEDGNSDGNGAPHATIADIKAMRHPIFQDRPGAGRAAAAHASARRRMRSERPSGSIRAKDYRVGNSGGASGAGGGAGGTAV